MGGRHAGAHTGRTRSASATIDDCVALNYTLQGMDVHRIQDREWHGRFVDWRDERLPRPGSGVALYVWVLPCRGYAVAARCTEGEESELRNYPRPGIDRRYGSVSSAREQRPGSPAPLPLCPRPPSHHGGAICLHFAGSADNVWVVTYAALAITRAHRKIRGARCLVRLAAALHCRRCSESPAPGLCGDGAGARGQPAGRQEGQASQIMINQAAAPRKPGGMSSEELVTHTA